MVKCETIFSSCRMYRYVLWRRWNSSDPKYVMFIGLNPSTADEVNDDPTVRRFVGYAKQWGYNAVCVTNLFAYRATRPAQLKAQPEPIGSENDTWLVQLASAADLSSTSHRPKPWRR